MVGGSAGYMQGSAGYLVVHKVIIVSVCVNYVRFSNSLVFGFAGFWVFRFSGFLDGIGRDVELDN